MGELEPGQNWTTTGEPPATPTRLVLRHQRRTSRLRRRGKSVMDFFVGGGLRKAFMWGSVAFLIFFIAFRPEAAAEVFLSIGSGIQAIAVGFSDFFTNLVT